MTVTYIIDGHEVDEATFLADEEAFVEGHTSYIRPIYSSQGAFIGFAVYVSGEAIGKVYDEYKHASLLLEQIREEHRLMALLQRIA
jgi:hypothetical protein